MFIFTLFILLFCGCEAGTTISKISGGGVSVEGCRRLLGGVVKCWEVWSSIMRCSKDIVV